MQTAKASRKQSSLSGKESAQGCLPKRLLGAQTKRWAEGIRVPGPLAGGGDFIFLGSRITADGDCSHEIKRHLLLGRKVMTNLDSMLKSRDITLTTKVCLVRGL